MAEPYIFQMLFQSAEWLLIPEGAQARTGSSLQQAVQIDF